MTKLLISISIWLILNSLSLSATAQEVESNRLLTGGYRAKPVEEALITLTAGNTIAAQTHVAYKAGQSVVLQPGFEAKAGSVFIAHTGVVSQLPPTEGALNSLAMSTYPNPFDERTTITYVLVRAGRTNLQISNAAGGLVSRLVDSAYQEAGRYEVEWKGNDLPTGSYVCTLDAGSQRVSMRLLKK